MSDLAEYIVSIQVTKIVGDTEGYDITSGTIMACSHEQAIRLVKASTRANDGRFVEVLSCAKNLLKRYVITVVSDHKRVSTHTVLGYNKAAARESATSMHIRSFDSEEGFRKIDTYVETVEGVDTGDRSESETEQETNSSSDRF